jgi:hypothetical protein
MVGCANLLQVEDRKGATNVYARNVVSVFAGKVTAYLPFQSIVSPEEKHDVAIHIVFPVCPVPDILRGADTSFVCVRG